MRREHRKHNQNNHNTTLYITGGVLIAAIATFVITFILYSNLLGENNSSFDSEYLARFNTIKEEVEVTSASSSIGKNVAESKNSLENNVTNTTSSKKENAENTSAKAKTTKTTTTQKEKTTTKKVEKDPTFQKPIEGEIIKDFAKDSLIYSETLKEWITHFGVDIGAEKATVVKAAADGTVKYIKNDPRFGLTIIIEHANGFETRYANLLTTEFVAEGEKVKAGQTIGTVGDTSIYEIVDEPHLHFEILKNSENVNPNNYIKF